MNEQVKNAIGNYDAETASGQIVCKKCKTPTHVTIRGACGECIEHSRDPFNAPPDLQATIARLEELDKARTQGEWVSNEIVTQSGVAYRIGSGEMLVAGKGCCIIYDDYPPDISQRRFNASFIAAAPTMMQVIREQQACIDALESALLNIASYSKDDYVKLLVQKLVKQEVVDGFIRPNIDGVTDFFAHQNEQQACIDKLRGIVAGERQSAEMAREILQGHSETIEQQQACIDKLVDVVKHAKEFAEDGCADNLSMLHSSNYALVIATTEALAYVRERKVV